MMKRLIAIMTVLMAVLSLGAPGCSRGDSLNGTYWRLIGLGAEDSLTPVLAGTSVTLNFSADGTRVTGSGGCNDYFGGFRIEGRALTVSNLGATKKACADPPGIMLQENTFFELMGKAQSFERDGNRLTIRTADDKVLTFDTFKYLTGASELAGTSWRLQSFGPASNLKSLLPATSITLVFDANATHISGNAGVNTYGGDCAIAGSNMTLSKLYQTEMARLDPPGVMQQEVDYLSLLAKAERYAADCCGFTIYCTGGELRFVAG